MTTGLKIYFLADFWLFRYTYQLCYISGPSMKKELTLASNFKSRPKARKTLASKFIKEKLKKLSGHTLWMAAKRNPEQLEPRILLLNDGDGHTLKVNKYRRLLSM
jgi:hypothetical protein